MTHKFCAAAFITKDGKFLFGKRSEQASWYPGVWDIFGGHSIGEESPEDTLKRELSEELNIEPVDYVLVETVDIAENSELVVFHVYFVTNWVGLPTNASEEHSEIKWFTPGELIGIQLSSDKYLSLIDEWMHKS